MNKRKAKSMLAHLARAREVISTPEKWTKGYYGKDSAGKDCPSLWSPSGNRTTYVGATCFCLLGALKVTSKSKLSRQEVVYSVESVLDDQALGDSAAAFNDDPHTRHGDVLKLLDDTAEKIKKEAGLVQEEQTTKG